VGGNFYASNAATITWTSGRHVTFLSLNGCPTSGDPGIPVSFSAALFDISQTPHVPIAGALIHFALGGQSCDGTTDGSGVASCRITPAAGGTLILTVTYAGSGVGAASPGGFAPALLLDPASSSTSFLVIGPQPVATSQIPMLDPRVLALLAALVAGVGAFVARRTFR